MLVYASIPQARCHSYSLGMSWEVLAGSDNGPYTLCVLMTLHSFACQACVCYLSPVSSRTPFSCVLRPAAHRNIRPSKPLYLVHSRLLSLRLSRGPVLQPIRTYQLAVGSFITLHYHEGSLPSSESAPLTTTVGLLDTFLVHSLIIACLALLF